LLSELFDCLSHNPPMHWNIIWSTPNETVEKLFVDAGGSLGASGLSHWMGYFLSMNPPISVDFTNVVDESEELPLDIDLGFRTDGEVIQPFLHAEIRKDRLHDGQTP